MFISPLVVFTRQTPKLGFRLHLLSNESYFDGLSLILYSAVVSRASIKSLSVWIKF